MKRVYTLYRVSTLKQVDIVKNDIPMQKISCHEFADRQGDWQIVKEYEEKGISGSKVSAEKRDAIQDLKEAAQKKEFDVLLVFMFDRLGRIENEISGTLSGNRSTILSSRCRSPSEMAKPTAVDVKVLDTELRMCAVSGTKNFSSSTFPCWRTITLCRSSALSATAWR